MAGVKRHGRDRSLPATSIINDNYRIDSWKIFNHQPKYIEEEPRAYKGSGNIICAKFGCGKLLTLKEQLYGNFCIKHNGNEEIVKS